MTSDNTNHSGPRRLSLHVCAVDSAQETPVATVLPQRAVGASFWPAPDRRLASPPRPDLLVAVLNGLRSLDLDGGSR